MVLKKEYSNEGFIDAMWWINSELKVLKNQINIDWWVTKQPEKISSWAIVFRYKNFSWNYEIVTRKERGIYKVRVKKWVKLSNWEHWWQTQKINNNEFFSFKASDKNDFCRWLWTALNKIVGYCRDRLSNTWCMIYNLLNNSTWWNNSAKKYSKVETVKDSTNLKKKTLDLKYKEINKERKIEVNYPKNERSVEWRITRCLRFASITDSVEDRYWIPRWLLMALMAQEWWWDPTVINLNWDWWAGLIHIQAINAADYWMKTLTRYKKKEDKNNQVDYEHWKRLKESKEQTKNDLKKLSALDDRFNPVMGIDLSARFLLQDKWWKKANTWDDWINAANRYAWRWMQDYGYSVLVYWTAINKVRWNKMPAFKDNEINKVIRWEVSAIVNGTREKTNLAVNRTQEAVNNLNPKIDWKQVSSDNYYAYLRWQWNNYGLSEYVNYNKAHPYVK